MSFRSVWADFPIKERMAYLNNASIGPLSNRVMSAMTGFLADVRDNGRIHYPDWCRQADQVVKADIARLIGAEAAEIAFIKNTTEGLVFVANGIDWRPGDNVILADIEYPSNVYCWMNLARRGVSIKWVKSHQGRIAVEDLEAAVDARTRVISLSGVQFSNGFRLDLEKLCEVCQRRKVLLNLDMIQWVGALNTGPSIIFRSAATSGCWDRSAQASSIAARARWTCCSSPAWATTPWTSPKTTSITT